MWDRATNTRVELNPVNGGKGPAGRQWWVLPSATSPTLLVPKSGSAGARSFNQFNDSMTQRSTQEGGSWSLDPRGLAPLFSRDRLSVATPASNRGRDLVESELPKLLGVPRVEVAISIGRSLQNV